MIETNCSLCKRKIKVAYQFQGEGKEYLMLWDNINAHTIGKEDEIPFPSHVFCEKCIPNVRKWLNKLKPENAFELQYCEIHNQMTNHINKVCQKCKPEWKVRK